MSWPDGERYSCPLQSDIVSLLLSLVSTLVFCRTRGVLSHRSLCSLLSPLQWTQSSIKLLSLALAESRILLQRLRTPVPGHLSCHSTLSSYEFFTLLTLWRLSVSLRPLVHALGLYGLPPCPHPSEEVG